MAPLLWHRQSEVDFRIVIDTTKEPIHDMKLDLHDIGGYEIKQEGNVKFTRFVSHRPATGGILPVCTYLQKAFSQIYYINKSIIFSCCPADSHIIIIYLFRIFF